MEFVSDKEGLRPMFWLFGFLLYDVTGIRAHQVRLLGHPELRKRPWPLLRPRGDGNGGGLPSTLYTRCCPFVPCTATVH